MDQNNQLEQGFVSTSDNVNEIQTFTIQDMVSMVLKNWYWFVISVVLFVGIGVLYVMKSSPVYQRNATIMVKDSRKGSGANEMAIFGELAGLSTRRNVDNELFEIVKRKKIGETILSADSLNIAYRRIIDGILYDMDDCDDDGNLYENGLHMPCPFCNSEKLFRDYCCGDVEWYNAIIDEINSQNPEFKLEKR